MPTIDVRDELLVFLLGSVPSEEQLEQLLSTAKAEIEGYDSDTGIWRVELKDTSRPDLWSTAGIARHIRNYREESTADYPFLLRSMSAIDNGEREVQVDSKLEDIRPYIAAYTVTGKPLTESLLLELIQSQEKLCESYGQRRRAIAMGVYRSDGLKWPVNYRAVSPETRFVPLGFDRELSLTEILAEHPKGQDYGHIVRDNSLYPYIEDSAGQALSFPPITNSANHGNVMAGDSGFFVEITGLHIESVLLAAAITACDFADIGYEIKPVQIRYPYETRFGSELVTPIYFQQDTILKLSDAERLLGEKISLTEAQQLVKKMGSKAVIKERSLVVTPPPYRNDFLHPVDVIEEIAIGRGLKTFEPILPEDFTPGRLTPETEFSRTVAELLVGLGYQEMIFNYLGARADYTERMNDEKRELVEVANPMTESYAVVRDSIIPNLLEAESGSQNAAYPHHMFEIGKVVQRDSSAFTGTHTADFATFLIADSAAGFNDVSDHLAALLFYLGVRHRLVEIDDRRFIAGRVARIEAANDQEWISVGVLGELHPAVLEKWTISMPCAAVEIDLDAVRMGVRNL